LKGKRCLLCIFHDITEMRRAEKALTQSEAQYRQLVETAQEGVWVLDKDNVTVFINPKLIQMLGYSETEILGKKISDFMANHEPRAESGFLSNSQQDPNGNFECEFIKKGGANIYANITASMIKDDNGNTLGILALVTDITTRKEMADKLAKYSKVLEDTLKKRTQELAEIQAQLIKSERLAAIGELAGMIGHDLRNPLTGIKNATYFLKRKKSSLSPQAFEMLNIIDNCIEHSNKIINDLLDYSREIRLERKETSLRLILNEAISMAQIPKNVDVIDALGEDMKIMVDSEKISRVFINLLKNAVDAMPSGGTIRISSGVVNERLEISFSDTGTGIPAEVLSKLFLPLSTTKAQGMGFGLAICKRLIEAHEGTVTVKTVMGKGTSFTVTLPIGTKTDGGEKIWIDHESSLLTTNSP